MDGKRRKKMGKGMRETKCIYMLQERREGGKLLSVAMP
jgi:hypothetical protein